MIELWADIPGFDGFQLSNKGSLRSKGNPVKTFIKTCNHTKVYRCAVIRKINERKTYTFYVHRLLWELFRGPIPDKMSIDHIDGDSLNNDFSNLRVCTHKQNCRNANKTKNRILPKGVEQRKGSRRFSAIINVDRKRYWLGTFDTPREAAEAYNDAAIKYFGEYAKLNTLDS